MLKCSLYLFCVTLCHIFLITASKKTQPLLLLSFDGFRWDYIDKYKNETFWFRYLAENGAHVSKVQNSFITKTFPGHWTIATGLYQESHGILNNAMFDRELNSTFNMGTHNPVWWNASEPVWISAERQGVRSGTYYWPGSEVQFNGRRATYWRPYNKTVPYLTRVDTIIDWFVNKNIEFVQLYYYEPDSTGHEYGPDAPEMMTKLAEVNGYLGELINRLKKAALFDRINIIVTADHGMAKVPVGNFIELKNRLTNWTDKVLDSGPSLWLYAKKGQQFRLYQEFVALNISRLQIFNQSNIPERLHFSKWINRLPDVIALADENYIVVPNQVSLYNKNRDRGVHGYDNKYVSMYPLLILHGPRFKVGAKLDIVKQVDIYPLVCHLLEIQPSPNNGSLAPFLPLLINAAGVISMPFFWWISPTFAVIMIAKKSFL